MTTSLAARQTSSPARRWFWACVGPTMAGLAGLLWSVFPDRIGVWIGCPARILTGWPCPFCGGTRALEALACGEVGTAMVLNPLVAIGAIAGMVIGAAAWMLPEFRGRFANVVRARPRFALALAVGFGVANWAYVIATLPR